MQFGMDLTCVAQVVVAPRPLNRDAWYGGEPTVNVTNFLHSVTPQREEQGK
jgi:sulfatase maturation enzyme AslB (radical SAM superfamily)